MRTLSALAASADRTRIWARFPTKTLGISLAFVIAAFVVLTLVDRVVPETQPRKAPPVKDAAPETALGQKARAEAPRSEAQPFSMTPLVAVAGVIGAAVLAMFLLKRALKGSRHVPGDEKLLRVRDVLAMGPKRAIYLIGLEDRNLVVGLSGDQLTLLSEYSAEAVSEARAEPAGLREEHVREVRAPRIVEASEPNAATAILDEEAKAPPVPAAQSPTTPAQAPGPRAFSFAAVTTHKGPAAKPHADRVPHKFRQLLEQAAEARGAGR